MIPDERLRIAVPSKGRLLAPKSTATFVEAALDGARAVLTPSSGREGIDEKCLTFDPPTDSTNLWENEEGRRCIGTRAHRQLFF